MNGALPPPPCEVFACPRQAECKSQHKACAAFKLYVEDARGYSPLGLEPSKTIYRSIYTEGV